LSLILPKSANTGESGTIIGGCQHGYRRHRRCIRCFLKTEDSVSRIISLGLPSSSPRFTTPFVRPSSSATLSRRCDYCRIHHRVDAKVILPLFVAEIVGISLLCNFMCYVLIHLYEICCDFVLLVAQWTVNMITQVNTSQPFSGNYAGCLSDAESISSWTYCTIKATAPDSSAVFAGWLPAGALRQSPTMVICHWPKHGWATGRSLLPVLVRGTCYTSVAALVDDASSEGTFV